MEHHTTNPQDSIASFTNGRSLKRSRLRRSVAALCAAGSLCALAATPQTAKADHPGVLIAAIAAGASVNTALVKGLASVAAETVKGAATVATAVIKSGIGGGSAEPDGGTEGNEDREEDGAEDGGGGDSGGSGQSSMARPGLAVPATALRKRRDCTAAFKHGRVSGIGSFSTSAVPRKVAAFMERGLTLENTSDGARKGTLSRAQYSFDGDVMKSPDTCGRIKNAETITWDLTLQKNPDASSDYFLFNIEKLDLTTTPVPKTVGHSEVRFTAYQRGKKIWSWDAVAHQGRRSTHGPLPKGTKVSKSKGELHVANFWTTIPVKFARGKSRAKVRVVAEYRGSGKRS